MTSSPQIKKRFHDIFGNNDEGCNGIELTTEQLAEIQSGFGEMERVFCIHWNDFEAMEVRIDPPESGIEKFRETEFSRARQARFCLLFNHEDHLGLWVCLERDILNECSAPVQSLDQIDRFIASIFDIQQRTKARTLKKIRRASAKQKSLVGELLRMSENEFEMRIGHNDAEVLLSMRTSGRKTGFHFRFPMGRIDTVEENADEVVGSLEKFLELGIKFRTNNNRWTRQQGEWIEPE